MDKQHRRYGRSREPERRWSQGGRRTTSSAESNPGSSHEISRLARNLAVRKLAPCSPWPSIHSGRSDTMNRIFCLRWFLLCGALVVSLTAAGCSSDRGELSQSDQAALSHPGGHMPASVPSGYVATPY